MAHTYSKLYYHIVFSTKYRVDSIRQEFEKALFEYLYRLLKKHGVQLIRINGIENHVHLLVRMRPGQYIPTVLRTLKAGATRWIKRNVCNASTFSWQVGYGIFTVSESNIDRIRNYIANQKNHHHAPHPNS